ncbi:MAG TPA: hypothetical protein PKM01_07885 [Anaerolineaceae bacterium]|nr:hypothetical protein [Anaerolineaceae bacterium]
MKTLTKKHWIAFIFAITLLVSALPVRAQTAAAPIADTPWPMYQHDPQHTGRSPHLGPLNPELQWTYTVADEDYGEFSPITITQDSKLLFTFYGGMYKFDPVQRQNVWVNNLAGSTGGSVLIDKDDRYYWGSGINFSQATSSGEFKWTASLYPNWVFRSSAVIGLDGNLYFTHDGLWSFTQDGEYRWFNYSDYCLHNAPAIGTDGTIYAGCLDVLADICAYQPNGSVSWCKDVPGEGFYKSPAIGTDGTIYLPTYSNIDQPGGLVALNPSGQVKWSFEPSEDYEWGVADGIALASDGSIRFFVDTGTPVGMFYAVSSAGELLWKVPIPAHPLGVGHVFLVWPITMDRADNSYFCTSDSRCFGIDAAGQIFWEYEFPFIDSIYISGQQPIIAADGILYIASSDHQIYAFADPERFPLIRSGVTRVSKIASVGEAPSTISIPITSSTGVIQFSAALSPAVGWAALNTPAGSTPTSLDVQFDVTGLQPGIYTTQIQITPGHPFGVSVEIPVQLIVEVAGAEHLYLPVINRNLPSARLYFMSRWFNQYHLASIGQSGQNRQPVLDLANLPQINNFIYSPDGQKAAIYAYQDNQYKLVVVKIDTGQVLMNVGVPGLSIPSWSPDSRQLVISKLSGEQTEVYRVNLDDASFTRVTFNNLDEDRPLWSPRGDRIATSVRMGAQVYVMNTDGSNAHPIAVGYDYNWAAGWSPDGNKVIIYSREGSIWGDSRLGISDLRSNTYTELPARNYLSDVIWSPDGSQIAYVGSDAQNIYKTRIYVIHLATNQVHCLTPDLEKDISELAWSPNGKWLSFSARRDDVHEDPDYDIYVIGADGTGLKQVTTNLQADWNAFWIP